MIKRVLAILIIISVLLLASCKKEESLPLASEIPAISADEVEEVSFGMWELYEAQSEAAIFISEYIENNFNIKIKPIAFSKDNYKEELDWMIGANMLPDVFAHNATSNKFQYNVLISSGSIQPIPKESWAPLTRLSAVMSWYEKIYSYNGQMYFVPRTYQTLDQTHGASNVIFYRSDWAKDLSKSTFKDTASFTDIIELLSAYRSSDTDGNTIWDTWGITGSGGIDFIWDAFLTPFGVRNWVLEDGKWIPGIISEQAKEAVSWAAQLYREGIIDHDIATHSAEDALGKFMTGKAGALLAPAYYGDLSYFEREWEIHNPDNPITKSVRIIPAYTTPKGTLHNEVATFDTGSMISSGVGESKMEKILSLYDFLFSKEARNLFEYGSTQAQETQSDEDFLSFSPEFSSFANMASWNLDKNSDSSDADSDFIVYARDMIEKNVWPWSFQEELFTNGIITPEICVLDINSIAEEKILMLIKTTRDFDADWDIFVQSMYSELNLEEAIAEVNARAEEYFSQEGTGQ